MIRRVKRDHRNLSSKVIQINFLLCIFIVPLILYTIQLKIVDNELIRLELVYSDELYYKYDEDVSKMLTTF